MDIDLAHIILTYTCLLFSLCVHEAAHAAMANYCGDDTARHLGRLTLNPIAHIDPLGTVILPLLMLATGTGLIFGWAKPVPFNPGKLNNVRRDPVLVAMAGPASNLLLALLFVFFARILSMAIGIEAIPVLLFEFLFWIVLLNFILMVFNLIPVPPLDGHHILNYFLPPEAQRFMARIGPFGILIAILVARPLLDLLMPDTLTLIDFIFGA